MHVGIAIFVLIVLVVSAILAIVRIVQRGVNLKTIVSLITALVLFFLGLTLYLDAMDFQDNFADSTKIMLFVDNNTIITGFSGLLLNETDVPYFYSEEELYQMNFYLKEKNYRSILGDNYKLFILYDEAFDAINGTVTMGGKGYEKEILCDMLHSDNPTERFVDSLMEGLILSPEENERQRESYKQQIFENYGDDNALKGIIFSNMIIEGMERDEAMFLIENFQYGRVKIYKESLLFKIAKYIPPSYMRMMIEREDQENGNTGQDNGSNEEKR